MIFQSTCPARGTTGNAAADTDEHRDISIHVPREGHDVRPSPCGAARKAHFNPRAPRGARLKDRAVKAVHAAISIHVPREGHDVRAMAADASILPFQSTCPARGTTTSQLKMMEWSLFQSTCPARGTTHSFPAIHADKLDFNPRAPRGARPVRAAACYNRVLISIHVPREGHDSKHAQFFRADLRKSYKYPAERDALPTKNVCKHIKTLG